MSGFPVLVAHLLDILDPEVGNTHRQTVVEAHAAFALRACQSGHSRHILSNGDGVFLHFVDQFVRQREIADCITIFVAVEITAIAVEILAQTVAEVHHRGYAVETESVEIVLIKPELAVREQEMQHLGFLVVETQAVPSGMLAACARVKVLVWRAIKITQAF